VSSGNRCSEESFCLQVKECQSEFLKVEVEFTGRLSLWLIKFLMNVQDDTQNRL